jgi:hypothetical protein
MINFISRNWFLLLCVAALLIVIAIVGLTILYKKKHTKKIKNNHICMRVELLDAIPLYGYESNNEFIFIIKDIFSDKKYAIDKCHFKNDIYINAESLPNEPYLSMSRIDFDKVSSEKISFHDQGEFWLDKEMKPFKEMSNKKYYNVTHDIKLNNINKEYDEKILENTIYAYGVLKMDKKA